MALTAYIVISAAVLGLVFGSAITALAYRVPRGVSWVHGRSACPSCDHTLEFLDLFPVLSWVVSRGQCRHCGARIAFRYPLTEILCASWSVLLVFKVGVAWSYPLLLVWGALLIALLWIDLDYQLLPDVLTFPGTLLGLTAAVWFGPGARHALFGVVIGSGLLWLLAWIWIRFRKIEGMGGGDIKLAAMLGVVLGWKLMLLTLFLAALAGSLWGATLMARREGGTKTALPFGALLAPAAMVAFLWGDAWTSAYLRLMGPH